jgi:hypothetical protein
VVSFGDPGTSDQCASCAWIEQFVPAAEQDELRERMGVRRLRLREE